MVGGRKSPQIHNHTYLFVAPRQPGKDRCAETRELCFGLGEKFLVLRFSKGL